jgi:hypothetical protein
MGRTLPPFSQLIEFERRAWAPFRRALRKDDQAAFDRLFDCAKLHVQAGVYLSRPWPFEVIAMAVLLEHHKQLEHLLARFEAFCHSTHSAATLAHERVHDPAAPTGTVACFPTSLPEGRREEPSQGTLPYPTPPHAGEQTPEETANGDMTGFSRS